LTRAEKPLRPCAREILAEIKEARRRIGNGLPVTGVLLFSRQRRSGFLPAPASDAGPFNSGKFAGLKNASLKFWFWTAKSLGTPSHRLRSGEHYSECSWRRCCTCCPSDSRDKACRDTVPVVGAFGFWAWIGKLSAGGLEAAFAWRPFHVSYGLRHLGSDGSLAEGARRCEAGSAGCVDRSADICSAQKAAVDRSSRVKTRIVCDTSELNRNVPSGEDSAASASLLAFLTTDSGGQF